ncbi:Wzz/FepE/Etk N-terminal domain-containing protein [Octadecabacter sp. G9-8]|uniref:Wzz/FepE/Etk N-terminal domain-containing protein n=1 Tax=Octadecabacter dasysiphoniae TaxID=2909341 RepID=A0ABS9CUM4_9RHOB|nr:Wzz/FepE/Etk N-terminal domain-containing protein [Octadecabacter dasysiphoniae]MCF2870950.1 Wzz/FepE/Etk N-terminal domain-containing protein [Octadecabacter dasysiphoniae]
MDNRDDDIDAVQLFRTVWRGKWLIGFVALVFGVLGFLYATNVAKPVYRSTATVAIESTPTQVTDLDAVVGGLSAEQPSLNTQIHLIRSRQLLRRLVLDQDLTNDPEFNPLLAEPNPYSLGGLRDAILGPQAPQEYTEDELIRIAVDRLRDRLSVSNPTQSFVFQIGVSAGTAEKATNLANALATTYINDQLLFKEAQSDTAISFLDQRTLELQIELNEAELEVKDFAASIELISPETLAAKNRQVKELRERLLTLDALVATQQNVSEAYQNFDATTAALSDVEALDNATLTQLFATIDEGQTEQDRF